MLTIIPFEPSLSNHFRDLNILWLEEYFYVEAKDKLLLENAEKEIIDNGGAIFFGLIDQTVVGCFAIIKNSNGTIELGKMAVDPRYQGKNIGQQLLDHAILYCKKMGYKELFLYSHTKLAAAIHIYKKKGFREVSLEASSPYLRSDIKMVLCLK